LGRSRDSTRKAIDRVNEKIGLAEGYRRWPPAATSSGDRSLACPHRHPRSRPFEQSNPDWQIPEVL